MDAQLGLVFHYILIQCIIFLVNQKKQKTKEKRKQTNFMHKTQTLLTELLCISILSKVSVTQFVIYL